MSVAALFTRGQNPLEMGGSGVVAPPRSVQRTTPGLLGMEPPLLPGPRGVGALGFWDPPMIPALPKILGWVKPEYREVLESFSTVLPPGSRG